MFPGFIYRIEDKLKTAGVSFFVLAACLLWMPMMTDIREPRGLVLGCLIIVSAGAMTMTRSFAVSLFMLYVGAHTYIVSTAISTTFPLMLMSIMAAVYAFTVLHWRGFVKESVYNAICCVALLNVAAMIPQACHLYVIPALPPGTAFDRCFGLTANPNEASIVLAICLPFFFRRGWVWCLPAVAGGLLLARTTNGIIASTMVCLIFGLIRFRNWRYRFAIVAALVIFAVCSFAVDRPGFEGRTLIYKRTAQLSTVAPLGWGFRSFEFIMPLITYSPYMTDIQRMVAYTQLPRKELLDGSLITVTGTREPKKMREFLDRPENRTAAAFTQAHNDPLECLFVFGYAGLALLIFAAWRVILMGFRISDRLPVLGFIASLSCSLFFFAWQIIPVAALTTVILGVIVGEHTKEVHNA